MRAFNAIRNATVGGRVPVVLDTVDETFKAVGSQSAHFNNAIGIATRDCLKPYYFRWTENAQEHRASVWERIRDQFAIDDTPENCEAVFRQSRKAFSDWKHDLHTYFDEVSREYGQNQARMSKPSTVRSLQDWHRYLTHIHSDKFKVKKIFSLMVALNIYSFLNIHNIFSD